MSSNFYRINDLGTLTKFSASTATAVNNSGQLIGYFSDDAKASNFGEESRCFLWDALQVEEMVGFSVSGINDSGEVIGSCVEDDENKSKSGHSDFRVIGYSYRGQKKARLRLLPDTVVSSPTSINNSGKIVGSIQTANPLRRVACNWAEGKLEIMKMSAGFLSSEAVAVNDQNQIVGVQKHSSELGLITEAVLWEDEKIVRIGSLAECSGSVATAVNNVGQVVGYGFNKVAGRGMINRRAFVWTRGQIQELGVLKQGNDAHSLATDLNDGGQIVGNSLVEPGKLHAFLWQQGVLLDLNKLVKRSPQWELISAQSINNSGHIACNAILHGRVHAVLLMPDLS